MVQPETLLKAKKCFRAYGPWTGMHQEIPIIRGLLWLHGSANHYLQCAILDHYIIDPGLIDFLKGVYK